MGDDRSPQRQRNKDVSSQRKIFHDSKLGLRPYLPEGEARKRIRLKCKLSVSLISLANGREIPAVCCDASCSGLGVCLYEPLKVGERLKIWIHFNDGFRPLCRYGEVVWEKKDVMGFRAGIKFSSQSGF